MTTKLRRAGVALLTVAALGLGAITATAGEAAPSPQRTRPESQTPRL